MTTKLTKPVMREVNVEDTNEIKGDVVVTLSDTGLIFQKGKRKTKTLPWSEITKLAKAENLPEKYLENPMGWLMELDQTKKMLTPTPMTPPEDSVLV